MNLAILLAMAIGNFLLIWLGQSIALWLNGEPLAWPMRHKSKAPGVRWTVRTLVHANWLILIFGAPLALGETPASYYGAAFSSPNWGHVLAAFALSLGLMGLFYASEFALGLVRYKPIFDAKTRRAKLIRRIFGPIPLAILEETVFRGVLLEQIYRAMTPRATAAIAAIVISSLIFSSLHFIRRHMPHVSLVRSALGLFVVGCVFGAAYVAAGHSLWLPIAIHAAGIYVTEIMKLYTKYQGPEWLIGSESFPHCGVIGLGTLGLLLVLVVTLFSQPHAWAM